MTEDVDLQPGRIRETPREPLYKRRSAGMDPLDDDGLFQQVEHLEAPEPIDDTSVDIFYLLDRLEELVSFGKRVPFYGKVMVEENEFLALVDQLRIAVPNEIKQAQRVIRERQTIIAESHEEAARILDAARKRAEYFVSQEGILNEARLKGEQILQDAHDKRNRVMGEIDAYALEQFDKVEEAMRNGLALIDESLEETVSIMREARQNVGR
jgi:F0F1-type ATP synthase membrane subunit b/b'